MPIYEYRCEKCGEVSELLVLREAETPACKGCGSEDVVKLMSAHNVSMGSSSFSAPTDCSSCESHNSCGSPGSCCAN
jgi:putative FmdB family regulatory protein